MDQLKMHSPNLVDSNIEKISALFPNCITETKDENGKLKKAVDFDLLKQELSQVLVEGEQERYRLDWVGKKEAILKANSPIAKTLRPCREESVNFDKTENLFIEGDNLEALKLLQENYLGKVKMIYIDPPYNTGNDFIYEDDFAESTEAFFEKSNQVDEEGNRLIANTESNGRFHSDWLSMMYSRLKLARNLLTDDGVIYISLDDSEINNLGSMCNEIFGEKNFIAKVVWQKKTSPDARMNISAAHDYIMIYGKNAELVYFNSLPFDSERLKGYTNPDNDSRGDWASVDITGQTGRAPKSQFYEITTPSGLKMTPPSGRCWAMAQKTFLDLVADNRIWFGKDGTNRPRLKKFLSEADGVRPWTWWDNKNVGHNQEGSQELKELFDGNVLFDNPKPIKLLKRIISLSTKENDIVLDFFGGSGTTAHALFEQNSSDGNYRKFIVIQLNEVINKAGNDFKSNATALKLNYEYVSDISKERIRRAGKKILEDNATKEGIENLDIGFRVLKIDSSNMKDVYYTPDALKQSDLIEMASNIKEDRTSEDLLFQVMLDWGLELSLPIECKTVAGKEVFYVAGNSLVACFDELTFDMVDEVAKDHPLRFVSAEKAIHLDHDKTNIKERFKQLSPDTEVKFL